MSNLLDNNLRIRKVYINLTEDEHDEWLVTVGQRKGSEILRTLMGDWIASEKKRKTELNEIKNSI